MPRSAAASSMDIVAWPRSNWARPNSLSAAGPITTIVAAEPATWAAPRHTRASSRSWARSVTTMKSQGCQFCDDGDRRPASRIWSRSAAGTGRPSKARTLRREVIASQVCMTPPQLLRGCQRRRGRLAPPAAQERAGPLAGPGQRTVLVVQRLPDEPADRGLDGGQDLAGGGVGGGPVADHRARVADEVGQRHDTALTQHGGPLRGVGRVRGGRDDPDVRRQRRGGPGADHSRPGSGYQDIGADLGEQSGRRYDRPAVAQDALIAGLTAQPQQPSDVQARRVRDAAGHGGRRDPPAAAPDDLAG